MRIAFVTWSRPGAYGGVESFLDSLRNWLRMEGHDSILCLGNHSTKTSLPSSIWCHVALTAKETPSLNIDSQLFLDDLISFLKRERIDVLHSHNMHVPMNMGIPSALEIAARKVGIPHVLTVHDATEYRNAHRSLAEFCSTSIATQSEFNRSRIFAQSGIYVQLLPVGIDFSRYFPMELPNDKRTITVPGRFTTGKGIYPILKELVVLSSADAPIHVLLSSKKMWHVGRNTGIMEGIEDIAKRNEHFSIEFASDHNKDISTHYNRAALTICIPQCEEGFGLVPLESIASGRPVVARITGGMSEWLPKKAIYEVQGVSELTYAVRHVLSNWDQWHKQTLIARDLLNNQFDIGIVGKIHLRFYNSLIEKQQGIYYD